MARHSVAAVVAALFLTAIVLLSIGCADSDGTSSTVATTVSADPGSTTTVPFASTTSAAPTTSHPATTTSITLTPASIAYAESLGGTSHQGQTLRFVIGASTTSEQAARARLEGALPLFGDMQSYFIVQVSDNFEGMEPGWWVVFEAYRDEPSPDELAFARRAFPDAYVKSATVKTADPIPVYEEMVGL